MPRWLARALARIHSSSRRDHVELTGKARHEAEALALSRADIERLLAQLAVRDFAGRIVSEVTGEWMYVFRPSLEGWPLYVKLVLRDKCIVVSFHEDRDKEAASDD